MHPKLAHAGAAVAAMKPASSQQVRSKFLNMIGIECAAPNSTEPPSPKTPGPVPPNSSPGWVIPRGVNSVATEKVSLKYDRVADQKYSSPKRRKTGLNQDGRKGTKGLVFNETVEVVPIPMRTEYSNRVRSRIWSNAVEIHENATRNTIEFATEGWDWRSVKEDDQMYRCVATNELLHPCWVTDDLTVSPTNSTS